MLPILVTGEPVLHSPAEPVGAVDEGVRALVADLVETMAAAPGVGLAAPQVGVPRRVFVWSWTDDDGVGHAGTAIDPELWLAPTPPGDADPDEESEGCLSFPGERLPLRRSPAARLRATGLDGERFELEATGWLARIWQHENDHLDGVLYVDRLTGSDARRAARVGRRHGWGVPGHRWLPGVDHPEG